MSSRVEKIASLIKEMGLDTIKGFEERDPQYIAISKLCASIKNKCIVSSLTILNSLVSYMLTGRGERHWNYFSEYFSRRGAIKDPCQDFLEYASTSPYLARLRAAKLNRIRKICGTALLSELMHCGVNLDELAERLGKALGVDWRSKTIVFAVKMAYYAFKSCGYEPLRLPSVPIPVDYRVSTITHCSGLSKEEPRVLMGRQRFVQEIWEQVSRLSGVPAINLDSLVWVMGGALIYNGFDVDKAMNELRGMVPNKEEVARELLLEFSKSCRGGDSIGKVYSDRDA